MSDLSQVSRNRPCPCGSGRRYKDCHGAIAMAAQPPGDTRPGAATRSSYRPPRPEWDHLSDDERDVCGLLMQKALKQQFAGRLTEAAANYAQVLAKAPKTHDALHMLGAIEMRRGNFAEAKKAIRAALALREPYPDIEHNLRMVQDLERAERVGAGRATPPPEALCKHALPALVDLALRPAPAREGRASRDLSSRSAESIHLIAGVRDSNDDAAWLLRRIAALLAPKRPVIWDMAQRRNASPTRRFSRDAGEWPEGGCHVFVGTDVDGEWVDRGNADRVIVFCQPAAPSQYLDRLRAISRDGARAVELVFPSHAMAVRFGSGHTVLPPPVAVDLDMAMADGGAATPPRPFTAGLIGRHFQSSSPNEDAHFLRALAAVSGRLEIYDPGALRYSVGADPAVRCRTREATALREFLRSIDCLVHPAGTWWLEGDGRELFMAMAAGVPVVCPQVSIFAEYIDHGADGLLYEGRQASLEQVALLHSSAELRATLSLSTRSKVAALVGPERAASSLRRLLFGEPSNVPIAEAGVTREPVPVK